MRSEYDAIAGRAVVSLSLRDLHGKTMSMAELEQLLTRHSLEDWLQTIGKLSRESDRRNPADPALDKELARYLGPLARRALQMIDQGRRLVSPGGLNTLAREASLVCSDGPVYGMDGQGLRDLARGLAGVVDLFDDPASSRPTTQSEIDAFLTRLLLRRIARPPAHLRNTVPRYFRLFVDVPQAHPNLVSFDFDARCRDLTRLPLRRYLGICLTFFVRFDRAERPEEWVLTESYYDSISVTASEFALAIRTVAATPDEWRSEYEREFAEGFRGLDDHRPLVRRPICEIRPGAFIPADFGALAERLVGDGIFWRLRPDDNAGKTRFGETVGKLLEEHLYEVARAVYPRSSPPHTDRLFREKQYDGGLRGPDIVLFDTGAVMACEIGANLVNVRDTLHRGSVDALDRDIQTVLLPRVRQLHRKILDMRSGRLRLDRPLEASTRIEPVVCLLDGFPMAPLIRGRVDATISSAKLLDFAGVGRVSIISAEEFELACAVVEQGSVDMTDILRGHARDDEMRDWPLRDYIRKLTGQLPITRFLDREFARVTDEVVAEIGGSRP